MFNFLFEGKIGDILAPVVPTNQLFLAIQHHKNAELPSLLDSYYTSNATDGGCAPIHVACRYNNRFALDLLLARGTNILLLDQNGNSPLHYAAKYGHFELCKYLVERGSIVSLKNKQLQTPYDVSQSHAVRQYLLPLQFQAERENPAEIQSFQTNPYQYGNLLPQHSSNNESLTPQFVQGAPSSSGVTTMAPPSAPIAYPAAPSANFANKTNTVSRVFQPDGFHSSASDPMLQQKYGHVIERPSIAPPPISPAVVNYSNNATSAPATVYNRYIPYNPNAPAYPNMNNSSAVYNTPPMPYEVPVSVPYTTPPVASVAPVMPTATPPPPAIPSSTNRLLGNKAIINPNSDDDIPNLMVNNRKVDDAKGPLSSPKKISPSMFGTDETEIITASASSSSVL